MGLLDSNIVKLGTKQITITGTATTNAYVGSGSGIFDCKNYGIAAVYVSGLSTGTQIVIQGGVSSAFMRGKMWWNRNGFPDYTEQVESIAVNNNTFTCDVSRFNQAGFLVLNGSGETVTLTVVLMTGEYSDISLKSLSNTFSNVLKVEKSGDEIQDNNVSVNAGVLKAYSNLSYPYAVLTVKRSANVDINLLCIHDSTHRLPIFNEMGEILYSIKTSGTYYVCISGIKSFSLESVGTVSGLTLTLTFKEVNERPNAMELRPEQNIISGVATLASGNTEKRVALTSDESKFLVPFFKFFCVNAIYRNSSDANVYKTQFKISKFDFMENGRNLWVEELASVANRYAVQTDWVKSTAKNMTIIFNFNAAEDGDLLYYEIRGIR